MKFYHGSNRKIEKFIMSNEFLAEDTIMQEGPGIYLTNSIEDAMHYGEYIHEVEWRPNVRKLLGTKPSINEYTESNLRRLIKQAPGWKENAMNWDENPERGVQIAVESIMDSYDTPKERYEQVWYDFYRNDPALYCKHMVIKGYNGFIIEKNDGVKHAIVFNPDTIKVIRIMLKQDLRNGPNNIQEAVNQLQKLSNKKVVFKIK